MKKKKSSPIVAFYFLSGNNWKTRFDVTVFMTSEKRIVLEKSNNH